MFAQQIMKHLLSVVVGEVAMKFLQDIKAQLPGQERDHAGKLVRHLYPVLAQHLPRKVVRPNFLISRRKFMLQGINSYIMEKRTLSVSELMMGMCVEHSDLGRLCT